MAATADFPLTRALATWVCGLQPADLSTAVQAESTRAFLNWFGCALGGAQSEVATRLARRHEQDTGPCRLIGFSGRIPAAEAAFINCVASSALAFDDTHLATVTHPTGPVAAALLTEADSRPVQAAEFYAALVAGIEVQCRLSNLLLLPPAQPNLSLYITGITGPVGAAAALARLRGYSVEGIVTAMGHAATQAAGFRATHGSMAGLIVPGYAARAAVFACDLAGAGITCGGDLLESPRGFVSIFTSGADLEMAVNGLGQQFETLANAYKPYPAGIVLHAAIDAALAVAAARAPQDRIECISVTVPPLTAQLADRTHPTTPFDAPISLQHWVAYALHHRSAGVAGLSQAAINDPAVQSLREIVDITIDESLSRDAASVTLRLASGDLLHRHIPHARGSLARPMSDADLDAKFLSQAGPQLGATAPDLLTALRAQDLPAVLALGLGRPGRAAA